MQQCRFKTNMNIAKGCFVKKLQLMRVRDALKSIVNYATHQRAAGRLAVGGSWAAAMIYTLLCAHFITSTLKSLPIDHLNRYTEFI